MFPKILMNGDTALSRSNDHGQFGKSVGKSASGIGIKPAEVGDL